MDEDWHTIGTANEKIVPYLIRRPKCALRYIKGEVPRLAAKEYILNRGKAGERIALENVYAIFRRGK